MMFHLRSPSSVMSPMSLEFVPSAIYPLSSQICRNEEEVWSGDSKEEEEEVVEEEVWSGDSEEEEESSGESEEEEKVSSGSSKKECDEIDTHEDRNEAIENCEDRVEEPKVGMEFDTSNEVYLYYSRFAKEKGFAVAKRSSKKGKDGNLRHVILQCNKGGKPRVRGSNHVKPRPQTKVDCPARLSVSLFPGGKWRLKHVVLEHNHEQSLEKSRFFKTNRVLDENVKRKLELNDKTRISLHKTYDPLQIDAAGPDKLVYFAKDCRNELDKLRRLRLVEGDAEAMHCYFMRMKVDNSDFFFAMDLNEKGQLRNAFWADARSRAACKEFGDVVTFDTTYLVNKYDMPLAPFVGVNHHGQWILLGCGLISHEDTVSFSWLFQTWMTCMSGCAPRAIITDQCMALKNALEIVFPNTRHRWCVGHIMEKVPQKLRGYNAYEKIILCLCHTVYDSLTIEEFEDAWDVFIKKYELQSNTWLHELYLERKQWVPAYVKDVFWAGMSSTKSREKMNVYFDGYIHSKTTIKQFVEQYENALAQKVESEKEEDVKSWNSCISFIIEDDLEKQFRSVYTNEKVKEFHKQFLGKLNCFLGQRKEGDVVSEYEVKEWVTFGEGEEKKRKCVSFTVDFNAKTNEAHCNCQLFEFRGMLCNHQLLVFHERDIDRVPDKYVLRRWCKNVKRVHTKVRINYDNSSTTIEARRHDNMCNLFNEIADLAEDSQEKYDMVMTRVRKLKQELVDVSAVCGSNMVSGAPNDSFSFGDGGLPSKQSTNIIDSEALHLKERPSSKRKQCVMEKVVEKKREIKKKTLSNEKAKEVKEIGVGHVSGTQESVVNVNCYPSYMGQFMWPNMMLHNMGPNMAQGVIGFNQPQFMHNFLSSQSFMPIPQSYMPSSLYSPVWRGQSSIMGNQVWGGPQPSVLEDQGQGQGWGGSQPSLMEIQRQGWGGGQQSCLEMMNDKAKE